jgi:uncharacterized membrane protein YfcA
MFDLSWIAAGSIVFLAACLQAITGFGFGVLAVPLFLLIFDAKTAVGFSMVISFFTVSNLALKLRNFIIRPIIHNLLTGAICGIPIGIYIYYHFDLNSLKLIISIVVFFLSIMLMFGFRLKSDQTVWTERIVGSISGIMTPSIGMPGPPIAICLSNQQIPKENFRATFVCYNALVYVFSLSFLIFLGAINITIIKTAITLVPFGFMGSILGRRIFPKVSQPVFHKAVSILMMTSALYSLFKVI